jgi:hypothetical protein
LIGGECRKYMSTSILNRRTLALLLAPAAAPIVVAPYAWQLTSTIQWFTFAIIVATGLAYAGLPLYWALLSLRKAQWSKSLWVSGVTGFIIGAAMWLMFIVLFALVLDQGFKGVLFGLTDQGALKGAIWPGGISGSAAGIAHWLIDRPDQADL